MTFLHSKAGILAVVLSLVTTVQAAYHMTMRSRPTMSLQRMIYPRMNMPSLLSRDVAQLMRDFDQMFDVTLMNDFDELFYQPFMSRHSPLPGTSDESPLALKIPEQTYEIVQDEKRTEIRIGVPGIDAGDINLQVDEDNHMLTISGKSKREENGISMHSSFERSFSLTPDIDVSHISAQLENGVLHITAPKLDSPKESVRRIDIVDTGSKVQETHESKPPVAQQKDEKLGADDTVIDLDVQQ